MINKADLVKTILKERGSLRPHPAEAEAFAPANIALCKYWGKRDDLLNLPVTSSLSISLGLKGTVTRLSRYEGQEDCIISNQQLMEVGSAFAQRATTFLDLFRPAPDYRFRLDTHTNIPIGAGLASSASGFAALVKALDRLFDWELTPSECSILARLGSGSACRSLWDGFVEWQMGERADGLDSLGIPLPTTWESLCIGLLVVSDQPKALSSSAAMKRTRATSPFYAAWPEKVRHDLAVLKQAIQTRDIALLGETAEWNALAMHALMLSAWPPVSYLLPATVMHREMVWRLRQEGVNVYFTQDAGPNLKLIFLKEAEPLIRVAFPEIEVIYPFAL